MWKKVLLSFLHGIFTLLLLWWYVNINYVSEEEEKEIQFLNWVRLLPGKEDTSLLNRTILVNTAKELELVQDPEEYGKVIITDRRVLARFFKAVNQQTGKPRLILCDILFDYKTEHDSLLDAEMKQLPQLLIPYIFKEGHAIYPVFSKNRIGLAQYYSHAEKMIKFQLIFPENQKTLPVAADEWVNQRNYEKTFITTLCANRPVLSSIIPTYYIRPHMIRDYEKQKDQEDLKNQKEKEKEEHDHTLPLYNLHELTVFLENSLEDPLFLENKFIVLGDFSGRDTHKTPIGGMSGVLILYNTFLTLYKGWQFITWTWVVFLLAMFTGLSYLVFFTGLFHFHSHGVGLIKYLLHSFLARLLSVTFVILLVSILSYLLYHIHVNILFLAVYFTLIDDYLKFRKDEKRA